MKIYLPEWPEAVAIVLVIGLIALLAWQVLGTGPTPVTQVSPCLAGLHGTDYEAASEACDKIMTATAEASVTPAWWQFWLHPAPTTFFSVATPVPTATP